MRLQHEFTCYKHNNLAWFLCLSENAISKDGSNAQSDNAAPYIGVYQLLKHITYPRGTMFPLV